MKRCLVLLVFGLLTFATTIGCSGPERAPHQPIPGVDEPYDHDSNPPPPEPREPEDVPDGDSGGPPTSSGDGGPARREEPGRSSGHFLRPFINEVAIAAMDVPGNIAIFPAMTRKRQSNTGEQMITGLGDYFASTTAEELELAGVGGVIHGPQLINDIQAKNRGLDSWDSLDDVYWIAERLGVRYAIFGTANKKVFNRLDRDEALEVVWQCKRVEDRHLVALYRRELRGNLARSLYRYASTQTDWKIGAEAPRFTPSLDLELRIASEVLARRIATSHGSLLMGKRVQFDPMAIRILSGERAELQAWAAAFQRVVDGKLADLGDGVVDRSDQIWDQPATIQGQEYATLREALESFEKRAAAIQSSRSGELSRDLSNLLAQTLQNEMAGAIQIVSDPSERGRLLSLLRGEASALRHAGAMNPATIAELKASGAQILVGSSLRPLGTAYQIQVVLYDVTSGERKIELFPLEEQFSPELRRLTGG